MENHKPHILKGAVAGLVGGLIGMAAMVVAEKFFPPHPEQELPPREHPGPRFALSTRTADGENVNWALGALAGAAYGAIAEYYPDVSSKGGATFGMTLSVATHEGILPALGLQEHSTDETARDKGGELATHIVYGVVTETVRGFVRDVI